jgi:hypothetical protein
MTEAERDALMLELLAAMRAVLGELAAMRPAKHAHASAAADTTLVASIVAVAGERVFTAGELIEHAAVDAELCEALAAVGARNAKRLGKALRRMDGVDLGGWRIERVGQDRTGALWRVFAGVGFKTRKPANPVASARRRGVPLASRSNRPNPRS